VTVVTGKCGCSAIEHFGKLETEMRKAARKFEFERAAKLRDSIRELREKEFLFG